MWRYTDYINNHIFDLSINLAVILVIFVICRFLKVRALLALCFAMVPMILAWYGEGMVLPGWLT